MTHLLDKKYVIVLPDGAMDIRIEFGDELLYKTAATAIDKLPGNYRILFTRDTQTEEGWKGVVGEHNGLYEYPDYNNNGLCTLRTATQSGHSLLQSKNIDPVSNWVVIEKI